MHFVFDDDGQELHLNKTPASGLDEMENNQNCRNLFLLAGAPSPWRPPRQRTCGLGKTLTLITRMKIPKKGGSDSPIFAGLPSVFVAPSLVSTSSTSTEFQKKPKKTCLSGSHNELPSNGNCIGGHQHLPISVHPILKDGPKHSMRRAHIPSIGWIQTQHASCTQTHLVFLTVRIRVLSPFTP